MKYCSAGGEVTYAEYMTANITEVELFPPGNFTADVERIPEKIRGVFRQRNNQTRYCCNGKHSNEILRLLPRPTLG